MISRSNNRNRIIDQGTRQQRARQQPIQLARRIDPHTRQPPTITLDHIADHPTRPLNGPAALTRLQLLRQRAHRITLWQLLKALLHQLHTLIRLKQQQDQTSVHIAALLRDRLKGELGIRRIRVIRTSIARNPRSARQRTTNTKLLSGGAGQRPHLNRPRQQPAMIDQLISTTVQRPIQLWQQHQQLLALTRRKFASQTTGHTNIRSQTRASQRVHPAQHLLAQLHQLLSIRLHPQRRQQRRSRIQVRTNPLKLSDHTTQHRGPFRDLDTAQLLDRLAKRQRMRKRTRTTNPRHQMQCAGKIKARQPFSTTAFIKTIVVFDVGDPFAAHLENKPLRPPPRGMKRPQSQRITHKNTPNLVHRTRIIPQANNPISLGAVVTD